MKTFNNDDIGYLAWVEANQHDFVVNLYRRPTANHFRLH